MPEGPQPETTKDAFPTESAAAKTSLRLHIPATTLMSIPGFQANIG